MSLEFARLDMSKLGDTHGIVMREESCGAALPGSDVRLSGRKRKVGECVVTKCQWGVSRQRDEVRAMASGTIACGSFSDAHSRRSPMFDSQNPPSPVGILRCPKGLLCRTRNSLGLFRLRSRFLTFYGHLKRLTQNVVVANCAFPHKHEQVAYFAPFVRSWWSCPTLQTLVDVYS